MSEPTSTHTLKYCAFLFKQTGKVIINMIKKNKTQGKTKAFKSSLIIFEIL